MPDVKRTIKITTTQKVIPGADSGVEGFPLRHWTIQIHVISADTKDESDVKLFENVTYHLHESFGPKAKQVLKSPPYRVSEDGWGEFELRIELKDAAGKVHDVLHDLNFAEPKYDIKHVITFKNPKGTLLDLLRQTGPIPGESAANGDTGKKRASEIGAPGDKKRKKGGADKGVDMDKLAEALQKLGEDDLLQVVQMVHDNKAEDSWMRNDVDQGEFHVDLYTLPDNLIKMLWEFTNEKSSSVAAAA